MDNDNDVLLLIPHLVAGVPAVVVQALLDTVGHASCQSRTVLRSDQQTPDLNDIIDEVLPAGALEVLDLVLHPIPAIFYGVQVWGVPRPLDQGDLLVPQEIHD